MSPWQPDPRLALHLIALALALFFTAALVFLGAV